jgi:peptidoglycan hydrolase CwlO-like protein
MGEEEKNTFLEDYSTEIYNEFESNFEDVRKTNDDMRSEADKQVKDLQDELEGANEGLDLKDNYINELEDTISKLENQIG